MAKAKKTKKKPVAKRRAIKAKPKKALKAKPKKALKAKPARKVAKVKAKAKPVKAKAAKPAAKPVQNARAKADAERRRLIREERALEHDNDADTEDNALSSSPEYIEDAVNDELGEELAEAAVESETSGDHEAENIRDEDVDEDEGGPFVITSANQEFAKGTDASNPKDAEPAGVPTANARPR